MPTEEEEHGELVTGVLHWNYRNLTQFPAGILAKPHRCNQITDIYLKENRIARLPRDISALDRLESLYLSGNEIRTIPREISRLRRLQCLDLSGNRLTGLPDEIGELGSLKYLLLDDNELKALPLRLADVRALRYLSVCDNQLTWLPQRPVYNLHQCELRVWRNPSLCSVPYSLWYHMFRDQQIRSLNIGCWGVTGARGPSAPQSSCVLKMHSDAAERKIEIPQPAPYRLVMPSGLHDNTFPASLLELCKRAMFQMLYECARRNCKNAYESIYSAAVTNKHSSDVIDDPNGNVVENLNPVDDKLLTDNNQVVAEITTYGDENNNEKLPSESQPCKCKDRQQKNRHGTTPSELIEKYFEFLPSAIREDMKNGPPSRCENVPCKRPVFDYAYIQFCTGSLLLIDSSPPCLLSAVFCSRGCARAWTTLKSGVVPWQRPLECSS